MSVSPRRSYCNWASPVIYIDLDKIENEIKENTELAIPSIAAALAAPIALLAVPITPATAPIALAAAPIALVATLASTRTAIPTLLN